MNEFEIKLNPDKEMVDMVNEALKKTGGICPCAVLSQNPTDKEKKQSTCICEWFRQRSVEGPCHCGKFIKVKKT